MKKDGVMRMLRFFAAALALTMTAACGDFGPTAPEDNGVENGGFLGSGGGGNGGFLGSGGGGNGGFLGSGGGG
jgi:hypothetical protein